MSNFQDKLEQQFLAELFTDPKAYYLTLPILERIGRKAWTCPNRAAIYAAMERATASGKQPDIMAVAEALSELGLLESVGGLKALGVISSHAISSAYAEQHAGQLVDAYMARQLVNIGQQIKQSVERGGAAGDVGTDALRQIQGVLDSRSSTRIVHVRDVVKEAVDIYKASAAQKGAYSGILTGFAELDEHTGGWQSEDYIILAARPSTGKTNVALSWIIEAAKQCPVLFFSAEMSGLTIIQRMIGATSNLDDRRIKRAMLGMSEVERMVDAAGELTERNIYLNDTAAPFIADIERDVRRMVREQKIGLVVIDYIGKIRTDRRAQTRQLEVADVSARLKAIAMEHRIPVIALAQLNRSIESRSGLPVMSDLRESGDLEQDADVVIFLHSFARAGVSQIPKGFGKYSEMPSEGLLCFSIAKQRKGPTADLFARFDRMTGRITSAENVPARCQRKTDARLTEHTPF